MKYKLQIPAFVSIWVESENDWESVLEEFRAKLQNSELYNQGWTGDMGVDADCELWTDDIEKLQVVYEVDEDE